MPLFRRKPQPPPVPSLELPSGEEVERGTKATLLRGKEPLDGTLYLTNRRLLFEAKRGDARWLTVPWSEVKSSGLYPWPGAPMGIPSSRHQCLFLETTDGEQVWLDFGTKAEREWLPEVERHASDARTTAIDDDES